MAEKETIARPYAEAVFERARETDTLDQWSEMLEVLSMIAKDHRVLGLVSNPEIAWPKLADMFLEVSGDRCSDEGRNLVRLLARNRRLAVLPEIAEIYDALKLANQGTMRVTVTIPYNMTKAQQTKLSHTLEKRLGKEVTLDVEKDRSLLGGVIVRAGDQVIDGSVRGRLQQMAARLTA